MALPLWRFLNRAWEFLVRGLDSAGRAKVLEQLEPVTPASFEEAWETWGVDADAERALQLFDATA